MTRLTRTRTLLPPTRYPIEDDDGEVPSSDVVRLQEARSDPLTATATATATACRCDRLLACLGSLLLVSRDSRCAPSWLETDVNVDVDSVALCAPTECVVDSDDVRGPLLSSRRLLYVRAHRRISMSSLSDFGGSTRKFLEIAHSVAFWTLYGVLDTTGWSRTHYSVFWTLNSVL